MIKIWYINTDGNLSSIREDEYVPVITVNDRKKERKLKEKLIKQNNSLEENLKLFVITLKVFKIVWEKREYFVAAKDSENAKKAFNKVTCKEHEFTEPLVAIADRHKELS